MLLKFKIKEEFQLNNWAETNLWKMRWNTLDYDPEDQINKFFFFQYVHVDNSVNCSEPRFFPVFLGNYHFQHQTRNLTDYILAHREEFSSRKLIPIVLDPLEGYGQSSILIDEMVDRLDGLCDVYFINGNNRLKYLNNKFKFYATNHWILHLRDVDSTKLELEEDHKVYISLNRMAREHRVILTSKLIKNNLRDCGYISWANGKSHKYIDYAEKYPEIYKTEFDVLDVPNVLEANPTVSIPYDYCKKSFLFLVTETHWDNDTLFLSEKVFKPIVVGMPFMCLGNPGTLKLLKELGFKTFDKWIDESYDDDLPLLERCDTIVSEIKRFNEMSSQERIDIRKEMNDVLVHNMDIFRSYMKRSDLVESLMDIGKQIYTDRK